MAFKQFMLKPKLDLTKRPSTQGGPLVVVIASGWGVSSVWSGNAFSLANPRMINFLWKNFPTRLIKWPENTTDYPSACLAMTLFGSGRHFESIGIRSLQTLISRSSQIEHIFINHSKKLASAGRPLHILIRVGQPDFLIEVSRFAVTYAKKFGFEISWHLILGRGHDKDSALRSQLYEFKRFIEAYPGSKTVSMFGTKSLNQVRLIDSIIESIKGNSNLKTEGLSQGLTKAYQRGWLESEFGPITLTFDSHYYLKDSDSLFLAEPMPETLEHLLARIVKIDSGNHSRQKVKNLDLLSLVYSPILGRYPYLWRPSAIDGSLVKTLLAYQKTIAIIGPSSKRLALSYYFNGFQEVCQNQHYYLIDQHSIKSGTRLLSQYMNILRKIWLSSTDLIFCYIDLVDQAAHTGDMRLTSQAISQTDNTIRQIYDLIRIRGGHLILTSDHGIAEKMIDRWGAMPSHTLSPVPAINVAGQVNLASVQTKGLVELGLGPSFGHANLAPTVLKILGLSPPQQMSESPIFV